MKFGILTWCAVMGVTYGLGVEMLREGMVWGLPLFGVSILSLLKVAGKVLPKAKKHRRAKNVSGKTDDAPGDSHDSGRADCSGSEEDGSAVREEDE